MNLNLKSAQLLLTRFYRMKLKSGKHLWLPEKSFFPGHHKQHVGFFRNDEKYDLTAFSFKLIICIFHLLVE